MRRLQRFVLIVWALVCPSLALAQGGVPASPIHFSGPTGRPLAGATVTFCTSAGAGFPCSPLASIFTNAALSIASSNPVTTDGNGNIPVIFAAPGVYILSVTGSGITPTLVTATVAGSGGGNVVLSAVNNFTGTNTMGRLNAMRFVDGTQFTTAQAAIADCTTTIDCWVLVPPGTQTVPNNISRSHLHLLGYNQGVPGTTIAAAANLQWGTPPADNKVIFTSTTNVTFSGVWDTTIEGITFDFLGNNAGIVLQNGVFETHLGTSSGKVVIQNCGTGTALTLSAGASVGQSINANDFDVSIYNAGKGIVFTAPSATTNAANNKFHVTHINNVSIRAVDFVQWADSNRFEWTFISGLANAAGGITFNSGSPASLVGVFNNVFEHCLCADPTNPGSYTGTLVTVNRSEHPNAILDWEIGPGITSGGGSIFSNPNAYPFDGHVTTDITDGNDAVLIGLVGIRDRTNTIPMSVSMKKGTGAGNYTSSSLTFVPVDGTNLSLAVVVPLGWRLGIQASGAVAQTTAAAGTAVALYDGTCGSGTQLQAQHQGATTTADWRGFSMSWVITGDGNSHTVNLCYLTLNAADAVNMENSSAQFLPTMIFTMVPST